MKERHMRSGGMEKEGRRWKEKDGLREEMGNGVTMGGSRLTGGY